jgi:basic amino acid/polyamine antiporter, APA family
VGFDVISTAAEETHLARRAIPRATMAAVAIFMIYLVYAVYAMGYAVSPGRLSHLVSSGITPVIPISSQYWHQADFLIPLTGLTAGMGATLAVMVGTSRVMFAMSRDGGLVPSVGKLHPRFNTPWNGMFILLAVGIAYDLIAGATMGALSAYLWAGTAVAFFALVTYVLVNVSNFVLHIKHKAFNWFNHGLVPLVGVVLCVIVLYKSFVKSLWEAGWVTLGRGILLFAVVWSLVGVGYAFAVRKRATLSPIADADGWDEEADSVDPDAAVPGVPEAGVAS